MKRIVLFSLLALFLASCEKEKSDDKVQQPLFFKPGYGTYNEWCLNKDSAPLLHQDSIQKLFQYAQGVIGATDCHTACDYLGAANSFDSKNEFAFKELEVLSVMNNVVDLKLTVENEGVALWPLSAMQKMQTLSLKIKTRLSNVDDDFNSQLQRMLNSLRNLTAITLAQTGLSNFDLNADFPGVKILHLENNVLKKVDFLVRFPNLEEIYLDNNGIESLDNLSLSPQIKVISLANNPIKACPEKLKDVCKF